MSDPPSRSVIHVDMDSFYVSVERLRDPSLIGKPVAVGGSPDGRGVVASASYEARRYGVHSAMPMARAVMLCPQLVIVSGAYSNYSEHSARIQAALEEFTPLVQMASQDEAYLDLAGTERLWGPPLMVGEAIRRRVLEATDLPCSLGIATNKLVAKVASAMCKPRGLLYIPAGSEASFFAPLPLKRLPGIGPRSLERLEQIGYTRLGQLAAADSKSLERHFGKWGGEIAARARGESLSAIMVDEPAKSISAEETFDTDTTDPIFLEGILSNLCEKVAYRLRKSGVLSWTISLKYRFANFETHTAAITLPSPIDDEAEMLRVVAGLLANRWRDKRPIRLVGVCASGLTDDHAQLDLLDSEGRDKRSRVNKALDEVRARHGYGIVRRASSGGRAEEKNDRQWGG